MFNLNKFLRLKFNTPSTDIYGFFLSMDEKYIKVRCRFLQGFEVYQKPSLKLTGKFEIALLFVHRIICNPSVAINLYFVKLYMFWINFIPLLDATNNHLRISRYRVSHFNDIIDCPYLSTIITMFTNYRRICSFKYFSWNCIYCSFSEVSPFRAFQYFIKYCRSEIQTHMLTKCNFTFIIPVIRWQRNWTYTKLPCSLKLQSGFCRVQGYDFRTGVLFSSSWVKGTAASFVPGKDNVSKNAFYAKKTCAKSFMCYAAK